MTRLRRALVTMRGYLTRLQRLLRQICAVSVDHIWLFVRTDLKHNALAVLAAAVFVLVASELGFLTGFENYALDGILLSGHSEYSPDITLVVITENEYAKHFGSRSPLDSEKLSQLLKAIAAANPLVIGVDIEDVGSTVPSKTIEDWPDAVWARDGFESIDNHGDHAHFATHTSVAIVRKPILGGSYAEKTNELGEIQTQPISGVTLFPPDSDGRVRRYRRRFWSTYATDSETAGGGWVDSFPWAVAVRFAEKGGGTIAFRHRIEHLQAEGTKKHHDIILDFKGSGAPFKKITMDEVLAGSHQDWWNTNSPLKSAVVLVGGTYSASRDTHLTPVGPRYGIEIVAQALDAELRGTGVLQAGHGVAFAVDLIAGVLFIYINFVTAQRIFLFKSWVIIALIVLLSGIVSVVSFFSLAYWLNFTAIFVGLWIHHLADQAKESAQLRREVQEYKRQFGPLPSGGHVDCG